MLQKAARQSDALASQLPDTDPDKASIRARIARLGHECGCAAGGTFLVAATLLFVVYAALLGELDVRLVVLGAAFIFVSTMLGKLAGILTAVVRLAVLRRQLAHRVGRVPVAPSQPLARRG